MIKSYNQLEADGSELALKYKNAIDEAFDYFDKFDYGEYLKKAIYLRYIDNTHTIVGVAGKMNVSESTVKWYCENFVKKVAENVGLSKKDKQC